MRDELSGHRPDPGTPASDAALHDLVSRWASNVPDTVNADAALARVLAARDATSAPAQTSVDDLARRRTLTAPVRAPLWTRPGVRLAATLVAVLGLAALWQRTRNAAAPAERFASTTTTAREFTLRDGTRVRLAPGSVLTTARGYGDTARTVTLRGEAWFSTTHDASRPFRVRTGAVIVHDIGTAFLIREMGSDQVVVRVTDGAVEVRTDRDAAAAVRLTAGDAATASTRGVVVARASVSVTDQQAIAQGRLIFHEAELHEVATALRRWYGVTLVLPDSGMRTRHVTADFTNEPVPRIAQVLGLTFGTPAAVRGDTIVLQRAAEVPIRP
jgi:transmembrane sensor